MKIKDKTVEYFLNHTPDNKFTEYEIFTKSSPYFSRLSTKLYIIIGLFSIFSIFGFFVNNFATPPLLGLIFGTLVTFMILSIPLWFFPPAKTIEIDSEKVTIGTNIVLEDELFISYSPVTSYSTDEKKIYLGLKNGDFLEFEKSQRVPSLVFNDVFKYLRRKVSRNTNLPNGITYLISLIYEINKQTDYETPSGASYPKVNQIKDTLTIKYPNTEQNFENILVYAENLGAIKYNLLGRRVYLSDAGRFWLNISSSTDSGDESDKDTPKVIFLHSNAPTESSPEGLIFRSFLKLHQEEKNLKSIFRNFQKNNLLESIADFEDKELVELLNLYNPRILHFSGHSNDSGISIMDSSNGDKFITYEEINELIRNNWQNKDLILFNSCRSFNSAVKTFTDTKFIIGVPETIDDDIAIKYPTLLYQNLLQGDDLLASHNSAIAVIKKEYEGIDPNEIPELHSSTGNNPIEWKLVK